MCSTVRTRARVDRGWQQTCCRPRSTPALDPSYQRATRWHVFIDTSLLYTHSEVNIHQSLFIAEVAPELCSYYWVLVKCLCGSTGISFLGWSTNVFKPNRCHADSIGSRHNTFHYVMFKGLCFSFDLQCSGWFLTINTHMLTKPTNIHTILWVTKLYHKHAIITCYECSNKTWLISTSFLPLR